MFLLTFQEILSKIIILYNVKGICDHKIKGSVFSRERENGYSKNPIWKRKKWPIEILSYIS